MMVVEVSLLTNAGFGLAAAAIFGYVGFILGHRRVSAEAQRAADLFAVWWAALAAVTALGAAQNLLAATGLLTLPLHTLFLLFTILALCVALWGLLYYLLYVALGWQRLFWPLTLGYATYFVALVYFITSSRPTGFALETWRVRTVFETPPEGALTMVLLALLLVPQILGALAYLLLLARVRDRTQRYRILLVSVSLLVWFMSPYLAAVADVSTWEGWPLVSRVIGLLAAGTIFMAYHPPRWVQTRFGIRNLESEVARDAGGGHSAGAKG